MIAMSSPERAKNSRTSREPRAREAGARSWRLTLAVFGYLLIFAAAWGRSSDPLAADRAQVALAGVGVDDPGPPVAVPEPSALAMEYYRTGNLFWILNRVWALAVPFALAFSGFSARLRAFAQRFARGWFFTVCVYIGLLLLLIYLIDLPLSYYQGFVRQHAYGMSNQSLGRWARNSMVRLLVDVLVAMALIWFPYWLMAKSQRRWWLYLALLSVPFLFVTMLVVPVFYDPLFNQFGPMKNKELERSILDLAQRAGIEGSRVFEVDKSADTRAVNAYVTGFWQTKRIVLWDTLIAKLNEQELLVVMGHEMGHYVLGHVVRSILLSSILTLAGLFLVDRLGRTLIAKYHARLGFSALSDIASVPLMMMLLEVAFLVLNPIAMAYSRNQEHEADRYSLLLTRANHAAAMAHVKLQTENLGNPRPGWLYKLFRASHPSAGERIDFANSYHPWRSEETRLPVGDNAQGVNGQPSADASTRSEPAARTSAAGPESAGPGH
jgi:Zn-dependent protease with chaperone function